MAAPSRRPRALLALVAGLSVTLGACTSQRVQRSDSEMAAVAPMLTVERFLQAANGRDFTAMSSMFGTYDGPVDWGRQEVELNMAALAEILRHRDYEIVSDRETPGRAHPTSRIGVNLTLPTGTVVRDVAFLVVQARDGRWLVEEIDTEKVASAG